jgi:RNA polymerase sigma factor (sigma-70 family)
MDHELTGRHDPIADVYASHRDHVLRVCVAILRDPDDAEDAAQEVFGKLLRRPPDGVRDMRRWLGEVARNHCLDRLRQDERRPVLPLGDAHAVSTGHDGTPESIAVTRGHLATVLSGLEPRQRSALVRSAVLDQPIERIAAELGISYGAAGQLLWRARHQALRIARAMGAILAGLGGRQLANAVRGHALRPRRSLARVGEAVSLERISMGLPAVFVVALLMAPASQPSTPQRSAPQRPPAAVVEGGVSTSEMAARIAVVANAGAVQRSVRAPSSAPATPKVATPPGTKRIIRPSAPPSVRSDFSFPELAEVPALPLLSVQLPHL